MCIPISPSRQNLAGEAEFESATLGLEDRCSIQLSYSPKKITHKASSFCLDTAGAFFYTEGNLGIHLLLAYRHSTHILLVLFWEPIYKSGSLVLGWFFFFLPQSRLLPLEKIFSKAKIKKTKILKTK